MGPSTAPPSATRTAQRNGYRHRDLDTRDLTGHFERQGDIGRDLATAGPVAVTESWGSLRSDSAHHCVLWVSEWPRSLVYPGFLAPLLLSSGIRRTFTLLYTPMRTDRAARDTRKNSNPSHALGREWTWFLEARTRRSVVSAHLFLDENRGRSGLLNDAGVR